MIGKTSSPQEAVKFWGSQVILGFWTTQPWVPLTHALLKDSLSIPLQSWGIGLLQD